MTTVQPIEVVWTAIAGVGCLFAIFNALDALRDARAAAQLRHRNGRWTIARATVLTEWFRFAIQAIFVAIGVGAMLLPPSPPMVLHGRVLFFTVVFKYGLIACAVLVALQSFALWRMRRTLLRSGH